MTEIQEKAQQPAHAGHTQAAKAVLPSFPAWQAAREDRQFLLSVMQSCTPFTGQLSEGRDLMREATAGLREEIARIRRTDTRTEPPHSTKSTTEATPPETDEESGNPK